MTNSTTTWFAILLAIYVSVVVTILKPSPEKPLGVLLLVAIPVIGLAVMIALLVRSWLKSITPK